MEAGDSGSKLRAMIRWMLLAACAVLTACSQSEVMEKVANPEKVKVATDYIAWLKAGDLEKLAGELDPKLRNDKELEQLRTMRAMIPAGAPTSTELVGYHWRTVHAIAGSETTYSVTHQFRHGDQWLIVFLNWRESAGEPRRITALRVVPLEKSLQEINALSFQNADPLHYAFLAGVVAMPVFVLVTLVACLRTKIPKRKWLWVIFVLLGFVQLTLNWTTGETLLRPFFVQLFAAGASSQLYSPWMLTISVPVGAILFWIRRPRWAAAPAAEPPVMKPES